MAKATPGELKSRLALAEGLLMALHGESVTRLAVANAHALLEGRRLSLGMAGPRASRKEIAEVRAPLGREVDVLKSKLREALAAGPFGADNPMATPSPAPPKKKPKVKGAAPEKGPAKPKARGGEGSVKDGSFEKQHPRAPKGRVGGGQWILKKGDGYGKEGPNGRVQQLQQRLGELGYKTDQDGQYGGYTETAVKAFQRDYGLQETGEVDAATLSVLRNPPDKKLDQYQAENKREAKMEDATGETPEGSGDGDGKGEKDGKDKDGKEGGSDSDSSSSDPDSEEKKGEGLVGLQKGVGMGDQPDPDVKELQRALEVAGFDVGEEGIDGRFGPHTESAVKQLQRKYGLKVDGIVGKQTAALLKRLADRHEKKKADAEGRGEAAEKSPPKKPAFKQGVEGGKSRVDSDYSGDTLDKEMQEAIAHRGGIPGWDAKLHPRNRRGQFREVLGKLLGLGRGDSDSIAGKRVTRVSPTHFSVEGEKVEGARRAAERIAPSFSLPLTRIDGDGKRVGGEYAHDFNPGSGGGGRFTEVLTPGGGVAAIVDEDVGDGHIRVRHPDGREGVLSRASVKPFSRKARAGQSSFLGTSGHESPQPDYSAKTAQAHITREEAKIERQLAELIIPSGGDKRSAEWRQYETKRKALHARRESLRQRYAELDAEQGDASPGITEPQIETMQGIRRAAGLPLAPDEPRPNRVVTGPYPAKEGGWAVTAKEDDYVRRFRFPDKEAADGLVARVKAEWADVDAVRARERKGDASPGTTDQVIQRERVMRLGLTSSGGRLTDDPTLYFDFDPAEHELVDVDKLKLTKPASSQPNSVLTAERRMRDAATGMGGKRGPITVERDIDGTFVVKDGNATTAAAQRGGLRRVPVKIQGTVTDAQGQPMDFSPGTSGVTNPSGDAVATARANIERYGKVEAHGTNPLRYASDAELARIGRDDPLRGAARAEIERRGRPSDGRMPRDVAGVEVSAVHEIPEDYEVANRPARRPKSDVDVGSEIAQDYASKAGERAKAMLADNGFDETGKKKPSGTSAGDLHDKSVSDLAAEIARDWKNVNFAAKPYLDAMHSLNTLDDNYGMDSGRSIVSYFLSNASSWRGETAKRVKAELRKRLK